MTISGNRRGPKCAEVVVVTVVPSEGTDTSGGEVAAAAVVTGATGIGDGAAPSSSSSSSSSSAAAAIEGHLERRASVGGGLRGVLRGVVGTGTPRAPGLDLWPSKWMDTVGVRADSEEEERRQLAVLVCEGGACLDRGAWPSQRGLGGPAPLCLSPPFPL